MSNAAKYKKKAAELELQKQFDKAVAMYVRAIEVGDAEGAEVDVTVLNKVGDLTLRLGRVGEAVTSYERAVEHYTTVGLFNNAIALCNKILRHAPGRAGIYLTLGRVCARKGMRGDATRNFLEYASRMKQEGRTDEAMRSLAEVAGLMPELEEVRRLVEEHAERVGIALPAAAAPEEGTTDVAARRDSLVFFDIDYDAPVAPTPPLGALPIAGRPTPLVSPALPVEAPLTNSLEDLLIFDPLAEDELSEEPATLDGLEALSDDAMANDVPSLLTPTDPVVVDPSLAIADGLTDALGFDVDEELAAEMPPRLDGLVSDDVGEAVEPLLRAELMPSTDDGELVSSTDDDELVSATDDDALVFATDDDALVFATDDESPTARDSAPPSVDSDGSTPTSSDSLSSVELSMLTPYRGVEAIAPPPVELDTLSPYDGVDSISPPSAETVPSVELETLSPYDGVASLTPPSEESVPRLEVDEADANVEPGVEASDAVEDAAPESEVVVEHRTVDGVERDAAEALNIEEGEIDDSVSAPETAPTPIEAEMVFADLLVSAPLPPAHSTRPARVIPRLDPHDFILPGELPPIVLPDRWLEMANLPLTSSDASDSAREVSAEPVDVSLETDEDDGTTPGAAPMTPADVEADAFGTVDDFDELDAAFTPTESTAAFNLALDRCARLRDDVDAHPGDWARRRRLAEALLEAGERATGLDELAATALGLELEGALPDAVRVLDDLVRVAPEQVAYHQKRVELAVRLGDRDRLRESYLDLADALVRSGHALRAEPVYVRVLELDPWDDRARAALGDAAPPPPSPRPSAAPADDGYVNLADWLADDGAPRDTRMRVKEPTVSGNEDADFDQLLQNFREGVARSIGEDDYESHYDLGVAYKEMGLLDDAVAEFQRALRSPTHRLPAYEALGQCFLEQGSFPVAVTVLSRALHEPGLDDEQRVGVLYLLGYACEALQRRDEARSYYQRVYATDIHFRDVAERLTALDGSAR